MDVMLEVLKARDNADCSKLSHFFYALHKSLDPGQKKAVFAMIADDLKLIEQENALINIVQLLKPKDWVKLPKIARLRIKHQLVESINKGNL